MDASTTSTSGGDELHLDELDLENDLLRSISPLTQRTADLTFESTPLTVRTNEAEDTAPRATASPGHTASTWQDAHTSGAEVSSPPQAPIAHASHGDSCGDTPTPPTTSDATSEALAEDSEGTMSCTPPSDDAHTPEVLLHSKSQQTYGAIDAHQTLAQKLLVQCATLAREKRALQTRLEATNAKLAEMEAINKHHAEMLALVAAAAPIVAPPPPPPPAVSRLGPPMSPFLAHLLRASGDELNVHLASELLHLPPTYRHRLSDDFRAIFNQRTLEVDTDAKSINNTTAAAGASNAHEQSSSPAPLLASLSTLSSSSSSSSGSSVAASSSPFDSLPTVVTPVPAAECVVSPRIALGARNIWTDTDIAIDCESQGMAPSAIPLMLPALPTRGAGGRGRSLLRTPESKVDLASILWMEDAGPGGSSTALQTMQRQQQVAMDPELARVLDQTAVWVEHGVIFTPPPPHPPPPSPPPQPAREPESAPSTAVAWKDAATVVSNASPAAPLPVKLATAIAPAAATAPPPVLPSAHVARGRSVIFPASAPTSPALPPKSDSAATLGRAPATTSTTPSSMVSSSSGVALPTAPAAAAPKPTSAWSAPRARTPLGSSSSSVTVAAHHLTSSNLGPPSIASATTTTGTAGGAAAAAAVLTKHSSSAALGIPPTLLADLNHAHAGWQKVGKNGKPTSAKKSKGQSMTLTPLSTAMSGSSSARQAFLEAEGTLRLKAKASKEAAKLIRREQRRYREFEAKKMATPTPAAAAAAAAATAATSVAAAAPPTAASASPSNLSRPAPRAAASTTSSNDGSPSPSATPESNTESVSPARSTSSSALSSSSSEWSIATSKEPLEEVAAGGAKEFEPSSPSAAGASSSETHTQQQATDPAARGGQLESKQQEQQQASEQPPSLDSPPELDGHTASAAAADLSGTSSSSSAPATGHLPPFTFTPTAFVPPAMAAAFPTQQPPSIPPTSAVTATPAAFPQAPAQQVQAAPSGYPAVQQQPPQQQQSHPQQQQQQQGIQPNTSNHQQMMLPPWHPALLPPPQQQAQQLQHQQQQHPVPLPQQLQSARGRHQPPPMHTGRHQAQQRQHLATFGPPVPFGLHPGLMFPGALNLTTPFQLMQPPPSMAGQPPPAFPIYSQTTLTAQQMQQMMHPTPGMGPYQAHGQPYQPTPFWH